MRWWAWGPTASRASWHGEIQLLLPLLPVLLPVLTPLLLPALHPALAPMSSLVLLSQRCNPHFRPAPHPVTRLCRPHCPLSATTHRVCVVNAAGNVLLDSFAKPRERVTDFRTKVSGGLCILLWTSAAVLAGHQGPWRGWGLLHLMPTQGTLAHSEGRQRGSLGLCSCGGSGSVACFPSSAT